MPALTATERILCARIGVDAKAVERSTAQVTIVGEMPCASTPADAPLFPLPGTPGARLLVLSGLTPQLYMERFERRTVFGEHRSWSAPLARVAARGIAHQRRKLVLLGSRVGQAFGIKTRGWQPDESESAVCAVAPNRVSGDELERKRMARTLAESLLPRCRCGLEIPPRSASWNETVGLRSPTRRDQPPATWCSDRCEQRYTRRVVSVRDDVYAALVVAAERCQVSIGAAVDRIVSRLEREDRGARSRSS